MAFIRDRDLLIYGPAAPIAQASVVTTPGVPVAGTRSLHFKITASNTIQLSACVAEVSDDGSLWQGSSAVGGITITETATVRALNAGGGYAMVHPSASQMPCLSAKQVRLKMTVAAGGADITGLTVTLTDYTD